MKGFLINLVVLGKVSLNKGNILKGLANADGSTEKGVDEMVILWIISLLLTVYQGRFHWWSIK